MPLSPELKDKLDGFFARLLNGQNLRILELLEQKLNVLPEKPTPAHIVNCLNAINSAVSLGFQGGEIKFDEIEDLLAYLQQKIVLEKTKIRLDELIKNNVQKILENQNFLSLYNKLGEIGNFADSIEKLIILFKNVFNARKKIIPDTLSQSDQEQLKIYFIQKLGEVFSSSKEEKSAQKPQNPLLKLLNEINKLIQSKEKGDIKKALAGINFLVYFLNIQCDQTAFKIYKAILLIQNNQSQEALLLLTPDEKVEFITESILEENLEYIEAALLVHFLLKKRDHEKTSANLLIVGIADNPLRFLLPIPVRISIIWACLLQKNDVFLQKALRDLDELREEFLNAGNIPAYEESSAFYAIIFAMQFKYDERICKNNLKVLKNIRPESPFYTLAMLGQAFLLVIEPSSKNNTEVYKFCDDVMNRLSRNNTKNYLVKMFAYAIQGFILHKKCQETTIGPAANSDIWQEWFSCEQKFKHVLVQLETKNEQENINSRLFMTHLPPIPLDCFSFEGCPIEIYAKAWRWRAKQKQQELKPDDRTRDAARSFLKDLSLDNIRDIEQHYPQLSFVLFDQIESDINKGNFAAAKQKCLEIIEKLKNVGTVAAKENIKQAEEILSDIASKELGISVISPPLNQVPSTSFTTVRKLVNNSVTVWGAQTKGANKERTQSSRCGAQVLQDLTEFPALNKWVEEVDQLPECQSEKEGSTLTMMIFRIEPLAQDSKKGKITGRGIYLGNGAVMWSHKNNDWQNTTISGLHTLQNPQEQERIGKKLNDKRTLRAHIQADCLINETHRCKVTRSFGNRALVNQGMIDKPEPLNFEWEIEDKEEITVFLSSTVVDSPLLQEMSRRVKQPAVADEKQATSPAQTLISFFPRQEDVSVMAVNLKLSDLNTPMFIAVWVLNGFGDTPVVADAVHKAAMRLPIFLRKQAVFQALQKGNDKETLEAIKKGNDKETLEAIKKGGFKPDMPMPEDFPFRGTTLLETCAERQRSETVCHLLDMEAKENIAAKPGLISYMTGSLAKKSEKADKQLMQRIKEQPLRFFGIDDEFSELRFFAFCGNETGFLAPLQNEKLKKFIDISIQLPAEHTVLYCAYLGGNKRIIEFLTTELAKRGQQDEIFKLLTRLIEEENSDIIIQLLKKEPVNITGIVRIESSVPVLIIAAMLSESPPICVARIYALPAQGTAA